MLRNLKAEMLKRNVTIEDIATEIGKCTRVVRGKIAEETDLAWKEIRVIHKKFFPDMDKDILFSSGRIEQCSGKLHCQKIGAGGQ